MMLPFGFSSWGSYRMTLLIGIIGGLLILSLGIFVWAMVMRRVQAERLAQMSPVVVAHSKDPMQRAINPCNPHAKIARGADAAERNFTPTAMHGSPVTSKQPVRRAG